VSAALLGTGEAQDPIAVAAPAEEADQAVLPHWQAGLAAWRDNRLAEARSQFETVVRNSGQSPWMKSAAAVWAARVAQRQRNPKLVAYFLRIAAEEPRTFYGLIACRLLGSDPGLDFEPEPFTAVDARVVMSLAAGRRALGLIAVGQRTRAVAELKPLMAGKSPALLQSLAGVAQRADLAALSMSAGQLLAEEDGRHHDGAIYPLPGWVPEGGFKVDRALLYAVMRQESLFLPDVTSAAGALGVMQLMPATAHEMAEREGVQLAALWDSGNEAKSLADPALNLTLAQDYVRLLLRNDRVKGNLLLFALAYNGGPATAQRWDALATEYRHDPLLFLESIPSPEARLFTKHVLTNYWIYRARLGEGTPDLDALAAGKWPIYTAPNLSGPDNRYAAN
jgi:soluble lytic murein transglycosylase